MESKQDTEPVLDKSVTKPTAFLVLGLIAALILTTTLNSSLSLKQTMKILSLQQSNYAMASMIDRQDFRSNSALSIQQNIEMPELPSLSQETNRIIVKFKENNKLPSGMSIASAKANFEKAQGLNRVFNINGINAQVYEIPANNTAVEMVKNILSAHKDIIEYAEVDVLLSPAFVPDDPHYSDSWHLPKIEAPDAWDSTKGEGVITAILDTGVDPDHPDLAFTPDLGRNVWQNSSDWSDKFGHGTKVAGVASAVLDNATGVSGVAGKSLIMPIKVSDDRSGYAFLSKVAAGITYAADNGARVANLSYDWCVNYSSSLNNAATYMRDKGGVVVIAAGNSGQDPRYGASDKFTCVSATDLNDERPNWSSYGQHVDVSAPGAGIYTTKNGGGYGGVDGTSYSAPLVSAVYSLIFSINPNLTPTQADAIVFSTAKDLGSEGWDKYYGHGRINAAKAVAAAAGTSGGDGGDGGSGGGGGGEDDTQAPTTPANLSVKDVTSSSATLTWSPSTDNISVTGYNVYSAGQKIATVASTLYTDDSLAPNTNYSYTVSAVDASGNESAQSNPITFTTQDETLLIDSYSVTEKSSNSATIAISLTQPGTVVVKYGISPFSLNNSIQSTRLSKDHNVNLSNLFGGWVYYYKIVATDEYGNTVNSDVSSFRTSSSIHW